MRTRGSYQSSSPRGFLDEATGLAEKRRDYTSITSVSQGMSNKKSHFELAQKASECRERLKKAYGGSRVVRHIKSGGHYILLDVVFIEANVEPSVLYRPYPSGPAFVRPLEEFLQKFDTDPPRKQGLVVGG